MSSGASFLSIHFIPLSKVDQCVHPNQITEWKRQLVDRAADVFGGEPNTPPVDLKVLHAKIGQLALENDFLESALCKAGLLSAGK
jgi:transposase